MDYSSGLHTVEWLTMASIIASLGDTAQGDLGRVGDIAEIGDFTSSVMSLMFRRWSIETRSSPQIARGDRGFHLVGDVVDVSPMEYRNAEFSPDRSWRSGFHLVGDVVDVPPSQVRHYHVRSSVKGQDLPVSCVCARACVRVCVRARSHALCVFLRAPSTKRRRKRPHFRLWTAGSFT